MTREKKQSPKAIMIDNYDSFVYNIVQYLGRLSFSDLEVFRNDKISVSEILGKKPDLLFISPGPSNPDHAGICLELVQALKESPIPTFGVCLGHQTLAQAYGATIKKLRYPVHGKTSMVYHDGKTVFKNLPNPLRVTRYHSLTVGEGSLPPALEVSARTTDGEIMAIRHRNLPFESVQFHPESILTTHGLTMFQNFCDFFCRSKN